VLEVKTNHFKENAIDKKYFWFKYHDQNINFKYEDEIFKGLFTWVKKDKQLHWWTVSGKSTIT
jgi:hypothetical protein